MGEFLIKSGRFFYRYSMSYDPKVDE